MERDGLFLEIPLLPAGSEGLARAERLAGIRLHPRLRAMPASNVIPATHRGMLFTATGNAGNGLPPTEPDEAGRLAEWDRLQTWIGSAVRHWFAAMPQEQRQRFDPRLLDRYPGEQDATPAVARLRLQADVESLLNSLMMGGAFTVDAGYRIAFSDKSLTHALFGQLLEALQQDKVYRVCDHCGRPFAYKSERAQFCGPSCKTLAWRKRKEEGGK